MVREISVEKITETVSELCIRANKKLPCDIEEKISSAEKCETCDLAKSVLSDLKRN